MPCQPVCVWLPSEATPAVYALTGPENVQWRMMLLCISGRRKLLHPSRSSLSHTCSRIPTAGSSSQEKRSAAEDERLGPRLYIVKIMNLQ